jgi:hypothetical protein
VLVREHEKRFYYGDHSVDKDLIAAVRVLINGSPIAAFVSRRLAGLPGVQATSFEDRPRGERARSLGRRDRDHHGNHLRRMRRHSRASVTGTWRGRCSTTVKRAME